MKEIEKKMYESPMIKISLVELEAGIAAGSAVIQPQDLNNQMQEEWEIDPDDNRTIQW